MEIYHGKDLFLINKEVKLKIGKFDNVVYYYLDNKNLEETVIKILNDYMSYDLLQETKLIVINDYDGILNNNLPVTNDFFNNIINFNTSNQLIYKVVTDSLKINNSKIKINFVKSLSKEQLKKWISLFIKNNDLSLNEKLVDWIVNNYPNDLSIIQNELQKLSNLGKRELDFNDLFDNFNFYYNNFNLYSLYEKFLLKKEKLFWDEYFNYWTKNNYDKYNIFAYFCKYLQKIRNYKIINKDIDSYQKYGTISIKCINEVLLNAYTLDYQIKNGFIEKNIGIDLFFLKNYDIILELS